MAVSTQKPSIFEKRVVNRKVVISQKYIKYMVSKNELKQLSQLGQKKVRNQWGMFSVEGTKAITTFVKNGYSMTHYFGLANTPSVEGCRMLTVAPNDLKKLSNLKTPASSWAAFSLPKVPDFAPQSLNLALDGIRDPGNLGTIIRLCDWFGIIHLLCSEDTVDCFNPKVVQASMGSLAKVHVHYGALPQYVHEHNLTVVGTDMTGTNLYQAQLPDKTVLVMGNEGQGIRDEIQRISDQMIRIPSYGNSAAESLNVAMATGIILSELKRRGG